MTDDTTESAALCFQWETYWPHAVPNLLDLHVTPERGDVTCPACLWALGSQRLPGPRTPPERTSDG